LAVAKERVSTASIYDYGDFIKARGHGDPMAPLRMVVVVNYACYACSVLETVVLPKLEPMIEKGQLFLEYRLFHLDTMKFGDIASKVSVAASLQGLDVWRNVHHEIFATQDRWLVKGDVIGSIRHLVDTQKLSDAMAGWDELDSLVSAETKYLKTELKIRATPTMLLYSKGEREPVRRLRSVSNGKVLVELIEGVLKNTIQGDKSK
jgi:hypothetical protein